MSEKVKKFLKKIEEEYGSLPDDLHITRKACALVAISGAKVIMMEEPEIHYCPLFKSLFSYEHPDKNNIEKKFNQQVDNWGMFTCNRHIYDDKIIVPFGASEMIMYAMKRKNIEAAVVVCEGAGTVVTMIEPGVVQGIGAYMNGLFYTTPIPDIITGIQSHNSIVLSPTDAKIDQAEGVRLAAKSGYRHIAVTVRGDEEETFYKIREIEKDEGLEVVILAVCNTGITGRQAEVIKKDADLAWACASKHVRNIAGSAALLQIGMKIPVFVLTDKGIDFISSYSIDGLIIRKLNARGKKHYITSNRFAEGSMKLNMGKFSVFLYETENLPVGTDDEPDPLI